MRKRVKGDYDDISNYIPKDKPTISKREKRKNQVMVASVVLGVSSVGMAALLRYTLLADLLKPKDEPLPSAYLRPTPRPTEITEETALKLRGVIGGEKKEGDSKEYNPFAPTSNETPNPSNAKTDNKPVSIGETIRKEQEAKRLGLTTPGALPYGDPVPSPSVAPPPPRPVNVLPQVKVGITMPSVTVGIQPISIPTPGGIASAPRPRSMSESGNNTSGGYNPSTSATPAAGASGAGGSFPSSGVTSGPSQPAPSIPGVSPGGSPPAPGGPNR